MHKFFLTLDVLIGAVVWRLNEKEKNLFFRTMYVILFMQAVFAAIVNLIVWICE